MPNTFPGFWTNDHLDFPQRLAPIKHPQSANLLLPIPKDSWPTHHRARKTPKKVVLGQEVSCRVCSACSWLK